jgi:predicted permease
MRDFRYAVRILRKSPVFTVTAILTLALCIGANTAIFTIVDRVLLRALPFPEPSRLVQVTTHFDKSGDDETGQTGGTWEVLRAGVTAVDLAVTAGEFSSTGVNMVVHDHPEYVKQQRVSAGFFRVLGIAPELGREFTEDEDRPTGPAVAVLSHALWARVFNADPDAIGKSVSLRGQPYTIVGVMPASFSGANPVDVWTPARPSRLGEGGGQNYEIIGRLKPGMTWAEANGQVMAATSPVLKQLYPKDAARQRIIPLQRGQTEDVRRPLVILWVAVGFVLLIGCVNIAGLLMARASTRAPEIATRIALGGGRAVIVRQLLIESLVLAAAGGVAGIALGYATVQSFATLLKDAFGVAGHVDLDARVLAITSAAALCTSVAFGLLPSLKASRVNLRAVLIESGSNAIAGSARSWPRRAMTALEVAVSVMLLVGAGLLIRTFDHLVRLRPGFDSTHVMTATLSLQDARYMTAAQVNRFFERTLERIHAVSGVENAAVCLTLPYERALNTGARWISAEPGRENIPIMNMTYVTPEYFQTLRIPILRGRAFTRADNENGARVIVLNQSFVSRYSPDEDPIGRQIASTGGARTVVGIVGDIQQKAGWGSFGPLAPVPASYIPAAQTGDAALSMVHTWFSPSWLARASGSQTDLARSMQRAVEEVDPLLPFAKFRTLDDVRGEAVATQRAQALLLGTLAGLALLLAAVGLYGLVANSIAERTKELGIRMALGATPLETVRAAAGPGLMFGGVGLVAGLALARAGSTVMQSLVWGVATTDPVTFASAAVMVLVVAAVATLVPSIRILRLNPIRALREG